MLRSLFLMMVLFCTISTTAQTTAGLIAYFPFSGNYTNAGPANVTASGVSTSLQQTPALPQIQLFSSRET
ncbi:MAG: hypothetical protein IPI88_15660 [Chitinophagaceae bacterium]|nr:hypothetical protein [Chitinophagaceae bacterium]